MMTATIAAINNLMFCPADDFCNSQIPNAIYTDSVACEQPSPEGVDKTFIELRSIVDGL